MSASAIPKATKIILRTFSLHNLKANTYQNHNNFDNITKSKILLLQGVISHSV
jgi:hypothetical protein